jgi:hypothetical protein
MDQVADTLPTQLAFLQPSHRGRQRVEASAWGPASTAETTSSATQECHGTAVQHRHTSRREDGSVFEVLNLFLQDRTTDEVLLYAFDSLGYPPDPPARGGWVGGDLVLDRTSPRGSSRTTFTPTPDGYRWSKRFSPDDGHDWQLVFTDDLTRS